MEKNFNKVKLKYKYSDQMIQVLSNIYFSFVEVLSVENINKIKFVIENAYILEYESLIEAEEKLNLYFDNGKKYHVGSLATGTGFQEEDYCIDDNGQIYQKLAIGVAKGELNEEKIQTIVHELCHAISAINGFKLDGNILQVKSGFNTTSYEFNGSSKGLIKSDKGRIFNEIVTENLAMQVMDSYNNTISHNATGYGFSAEALKHIFRNQNINSIIIDDYLNNNSNFLLKINDLINQKDLQNIVMSFYNIIDQSNIIIKEYLDKLCSLTPEEFFKVYITNVNSINKPEGVDKETFKLMKKIDKQIIYELGMRLKKYKTL